MAIAWGSETTRVYWGRKRSMTGPREPTMSAAAAVAAYLEANDTVEADSFERRFDLCSSALYRYFAVRTGDAHLADDLMQQLWLHARKRAADIPMAQVEFWLQAVARNLVATHWRVVGRRPAHVPIADAAVAADLADRLVSHDLPTDQLERREVRDQLSLAITELDAVDQELIVGHYFKNESHAALAGRLAISPRAIEGRLYRARQALRARLQALE